MQFIEALEGNVRQLCEKANELRQRIDLLKSHGFTADVTTNELVKTCIEIGKLSDAIQRELGSMR